MSVSTQTLSDTLSPSSSDEISDDLSFEEIVPEGIRLEDTSLNTIEDINIAIDKYKDLILKTEGCSNDRKWLVRTIIELRYKLEILKENDKYLNFNQENKREEDEIILAGHHFILTKSYNKYINKCDVCCGYLTLIRIIIPWYVCQDCNYNTHIKCVSATRRTCAYVKAGEDPLYELNICPEVTLLDQKYKCHECKTHIIFHSFISHSSLSSFNSSSCVPTSCITDCKTDNDWSNPRLCDYDGHYYCASCHWLDQSVIPARVLLNWDFRKYSVCRANYQLLKIMMKRPILNINEINSNLFGFIEELAKVKKYREDLLLMKQYLITCRVALESNLLWNAMETRPNLIKYKSCMFSLKDLIDVNSNVLVTFLENVMEKFKQHIKKDCSICYGRGYICELCSGKAIIFPFDSSVYVCNICQTVYHKHCWLHKNLCTKCERINKRNKNSNNKQEDDIDGNIKFNGIPNKLQTEIASTSGIQNEIASASGIQNEITSASRIQNDIASASGIQNEIASASGIQNEIISASGIQTKIASISGIQNEIASASGIQTEIFSVSRIQIEIASASGIQNDIASASGIQNEIASASGIQNEIISASRIQNDIASASGIQTEIASSNTNLTKKYQTNNIATNSFEIDTNEKDSQPLLNNTIDIVHCHRSNSPRSTPNIIHSSRSNSPSSNPNIIHSSRSNPNIIDSSRSNSPSSNSNIIHSSFSNSNIIHSSRSNPNIIHSFRSNPNIIHSSRPKSPLSRTNFNKKKFQVESLDFDVEDAIEIGKEIDV